jgi:hypothetical protein
MFTVINFIYYRGNMKEKRTKNNNYSRYDFIEGTSERGREIEKKLLKNQRKIHFFPFFKFKIENSEFRKPP